MSGLERYDRQLRVEGWDQGLLSSSTVFIAGVGAIGCEVAKNLAMMGVGRIVLADYDYVELSNLSRQLLFRDTDIGRGKAETAAERLQEINPNIHVDYYSGDVRTIGEGVFKSCDVIFSCLDNWASRRWLNSVAVSLGTPLIDGAMSGFYGNVQLVLPGKTACLECQSINLLPREEKLAECTLKRRRPEDLVMDLREQGIEISLSQAEKLFELNIKTMYDIKYARLHTLAATVETDVVSLVEEIRSKLMPPLPALQSVAAVVAGLMSNIGLKLMHRGRLGKPTTRLIVYDGLNSRLSRVKISRDPLCIVCGESGSEVVELVFDISSSVSMLKEALATNLGLPDTEIIYGSRRLDDDETLASAGVKPGDILYVSTMRLYEPLAIRIVSKK